MPSGCVHFSWDCEGKSKQPIFFAVPWLYIGFPPNRCWIYDLRFDSSSPSNVKILFVMQRRYNATQFPACFLRLLCQFCLSIYLSHPTFCRNLCFCLTTFVSSSRFPRCVVQRLFQRLHVYISTYLISRNLHSCCPLPSSDHWSRECPSGSGGGGGGNW